LPLRTSGSRFKLIGAALLLAAGGTTFLLDREGVVRKVALDGLFRLAINSCNRSQNSVLALPET